MIIRSDKCIFDSKFSERILKLRNIKKLYQKDAAKNIGVGISTYQRYEKGDNPTGKNLKKIIDFYGCSEQWLLTGEGEPYPNINVERGGIDPKILNIVNSAIIEFRHRNKQKYLHGIDFAIALTIHVLYNGIKKTPSKEEVAEFVEAIYKVGSKFPKGIELTQREYTELLNWGSIPAPEVDNETVGWEPTQKNDV